MIRKRFGLSIVVCLSLSMRGFAPPAIAADGESGGVPAAPNGEPAAPDANAVVPELPIVFDHYVVDAGEVEDDMNLIYAFKFTNMSNRPQRVELVNYCSSCVKPEITPSLVLGGQSGMVIVEIPTHGKEGEVRAVTTIGVNGFQERADLSLTAQVKKKVRIEPRQWSVEEVLVGQGASANMTLVVKGAGVEVEEIDSKNPMLAVDVAGPGKVLNDGGRERTEIPLRVTLGSQAPLGRIIAPFTIRTNRGSASGEFSTRVVGNLVAKPEFVSTGRSFAHQEIEATVEITHRHGEVLNLSEVALVNAPDGDLTTHTRVLEMLEAVSTQITRAVEGRKAIVTIKFVAPARLGHYELQLHVKGRGKGEDINVPIRFLIVE